MSAAEILTRMPVEIEAEVSEIVSRIPRHGAPSAAEPERIMDSAPTPDYVTHAEGVSRIGAVTAEIAVRDFEAAAKAVEEMGKDLVGLAAKCEAMVQDVNKAIEFVKGSAALYREEARKTFERIESAALMNENVRKTCVELRNQLRKTKEFTVNHPVEEFTVNHPVEDAQAAE
jgi:hypothetical protein